MSSELNVQFNLNTSAAEAGAKKIKDEVSNAKTDIEKPVKINIDVASSVATMARSFNDIRGAVTSFASGISDAMHSMAAMADEQNRLSTQSQRLHLDFDAAAGAAGRFVDETSAMTVATQFAARGINLTQVQLNDLMHVAAATAQTLGTEVSVEANNLTEALIRGRENSLAPFGEAFTRVSGEAHTVAQRLAVLATRSGEVETATDNATTSMERFQDSIDDAKRVFSTAFIEGLARMSELGVQTSQVSTDMEDMNRNISAAGSTAANMITQLKLGVEGIGAAGYLAVAPLIDLVRILISAKDGVAGMRAEIERLSREGSTRTANDLLMQIGNQLEHLQSDTGAPRPTERANHPVSTVAYLGEFGTEAGNGRGAGHHAAAAGIHAETEAQIRAGAEAVRIAEQHRSDAEHAISLDERVSRAQDILTSAITETTRASEAMEHAHQTPAERTALVSALNAETTARHDLTSATEAQANATRILADKARDLAIAEDIRTQEATDKLRDTTSRELQQAEVNRTSAVDKQRLNDAYAQERTYGGRMKALLHEEVDAKKELAGATLSSFQTMGSAMAKHTELVMQHKESVGAAAQNMVKDILSAIGSEAMIKGAMMMAEGAAALAGIYTAPLAAGNFAAGAAFFGVGALASAAGAAIPSAGSGLGGGGGATAGAASSASTSRSETPMRSGSAGGSEAPKNITINFSAFQSNEAAQALIVRSLREAGYNGRTAVGSSFSSPRR